GSVALDLLWETQDSLLPLFRVLSPRMRTSSEERYEWETMDCGDYRCVIEMHQTLSLQPNDDKTVSISEEEWDRLQFYARRIKVIDDKPLLRGEEFKTHVQRNTLKALFSRAGEVLLPRVHRLLLGERMRELLEHADARARSVGEAGTRVVSLNLADPAYYLKRHEWLPAALCRLDGLRALGICLDRRLGLYPILRSREWLEELHFSFPAPEDDDNDLFYPVTDRQAAPAPGFLRLKALRMDVPTSLDGPATALKAMSTTPLKLEKLHILGYEHEYDSEGCARVLYAAIRAACDPAALRDLAVVTHTSRDSVPPSPRALFGDLVAFPNITRAEIHICAMGSDVDGALDVLTAAWPRLERLVFVNRHRRPWEPKDRFTLCSLAGIACLAWRCPDLAYLSFPMSLESVPEPVIPDGRPLLERRVVFNVGPQRQLKEGVPQDFMNAVLGYLGSIFPYPTLEFVKYENGGYYRAWLWDDDFRGQDMDNEGGVEERGVPAEKGKKKANKKAKAAHATPGSKRGGATAKNSTAKESSGANASVPNVASKQVMASSSGAKSSDTSTSTGAELANFLEVGGHRLRAKRSTTHESGGGTHLARRGRGGEEDLSGKASAGKARGRGNRYFSGQSRTRKDHAKKSDSKRK
ncbi:hypothetical protein HDZ31DRAFT_50480, partial [Schizophyllum fasciatum]